MGNTSKKSGEELTNLPEGQGVIITAQEPKKQPKSQPEIVTPEERIEQVKEVLRLMEEGTSENKACEIAGIHRNTFRSAAMKNELADEYARAMIALAQDQIEKAEKTIEDMRTGTIDSQMARVELDARKWFASKFLPRRYGDKIDHTTNGKDLPTPILGSLPAQNAPSDVLDLT